MWRSVASNAITVLTGVLLLVAGLLVWAERQYTAPGPHDMPVCVRVEPGSTMTRVSKDLDAQGAVTSAWLFRLGADYSGKADLLKAGSFLIGPHASMAEIVDAVTRGGASTCGTEINLRVGIVTAQVEVRKFDAATNRYAQVLTFDPRAGEAPQDYADLREEPDLRYRVTLAEGVTGWQVVDALNAVSFLSGTVETLPAEGTLSPDSYEVVLGADRAQLVREMQARQAAVLEVLWARRAGDLPIDTREEALILASLIEKETGLPEERRQVASVFVNRLKAGMRLQTDPAVIYGLTEGKGPLGRGLRRSELRTPTPWNTYVIDGLPPTPIANPGRASIEAALNPAQTDYLYFVADGSGGHAFARTLAEHNENVAQWRRIEAERAGD